MAGVVCGERVSVKRGVVQNVEPGRECFGRRDLQGVQGEIGDMLCGVWCAVPVQCQCFWKVADCTFLTSTSSSSSTPRGHTCNVC